MQFSIQHIQDHLRFSFVGGSPLVTVQPFLAEDMSAVKASTLHEAVKIEFKLTDPLLKIGQSVYIYSLTKIEDKNRQASNFGQSYTYVAVLVAGEVCDLIFIADALHLADVVHRLSPLSVI
jgi:hypothetical protein